jgi:hypothetical protein
MKGTQKVWIFVALLFFVTLFVAFGTNPGHTQQNLAGKPTPKETPDFTKYPVADLEAPEPGNSAEGRERSLKNKRYDKHPILIGGLGPNDTAVGVHDAEPEPPTLPVAESRLIVIGKILDSRAFVSNNRKGVYSEYSLQVQSIIKDDKGPETRAGDIVTIDRSGGQVRYPNGQKVMYFIAGQDLPEVGQMYTVFLNKEGDEENPNYKIITAYQLKDGQVFPLDKFPAFGEFKGMDAKIFVNRIKTPSN